MEQAQVHEVLEAQSDIIGAKLWQDLEARLLLAEEDRDYASIFMQAWAAGCGWALGRSFARLEQAYGGSPGIVGADMMVLLMQRVWEGALAGLRVAER